MMDKAKILALVLVLLGIVVALFEYIIIPVGLSVAKQSQELEERRAAFQVYCWRRGGVILEQEDYGGVGLVEVCQAHTGPTVPFHSWKPVPAEAWVEVERK